MRADLTFHRAAETSTMPHRKLRSHAYGAWLLPDDIERLRDLQAQFGGVSASEVFRRALASLYENVTKPN